MANLLPKATLSIAFLPFYYFKGNRGLKLK